MDNMTLADTAPRKPSSWLIATAIIFTVINLVIYFWPTPAELSPTTDQTVLEILESKTAFRVEATVTEPVKQVDENTWQGVSCLYIREAGVTYRGECDFVENLTSDKIILHIDEFERRNAP